MMLPFINGMTSSRDIAFNIRVETLKHAGCLLIAGPDNRLFMSRPLTK